MPNRRIRIDPLKERETNSRRKNLSDCAAPMKGSRKSKSAVADAICERLVQASGGLSVWETSLALLLLASRSLPGSRSRAAALASETAGRILEDEKREEEKREKEKQREEEEEEEESSSATRWRCLEALFFVWAVRRAELHWGRPLVDLKTILVALIPAVERCRLLTRPWKDEEKEGEQTNAEFDLECRKNLALELAEIVYRQCADDLSGEQIPHVASDRPPHYFGQGTYVPPQGWCFKNTCLTVWIAAMAAHLGGGAKALEWASWCREGGMNGLWVPLRQDWLNGERSPQEVYMALSTSISVDPPGVYVSQLSRKVLHHWFTDALEGRLSTELQLVYALALKPGLAHPSVAVRGQRDVAAGVCW